jgi:hypothetical protein
MGQVLGGAGVPDTLHLRDRAALLFAGRDAVLSGPSAARLHDMEVVASFSCVTVPAERHRRAAGVRFLREAVDDGDRMQIDGIQVTTPDRTVFDCLRVLPRRPASTLLDRALQKNWVTLESLAGRTAARRGYRHSRRLQTFVNQVDPGGRSSLERQVIELVVGAGMSGWCANYEVFDSAGLIGLVDLAFPRLRLAIELDGRAWHSAGDRFQRDRTRQNRLVNAGWTVLRFTWEDVTERPAEVVASIRAALTRLAS